MSRLKLTSWQRRQLHRQLQQTQEASVYRRTLAILEFDQGRSVTQIAQLLKVSRQSVYNWIAAYAQERCPKALVAADRPGRPRRWTAAVEALLPRLLNQAPDEVGYFAVNWTVPLLQDQLYQARGQAVSDDTVRRALRRLGYVWKRPRYVLAPDPERAKKNGGFGVKSRRCHPVACCWPKMKPICCSFHPCGQPGRGGASREQFC